METRVTSTAGIHLPLDTGTANHPQLCVKIQGGSQQCQKIVLIRLYLFSSYSLNIYEDR